MFDYYSDIFFYKAFSTLDVLGHILSIIHRLSWGTKEKINFKSSIWKRKDKNQMLHKAFNQIRYSKELEKAEALRNNTTHNFSDNMVDSGVVRNENELSLTVGKYTPSEEIYSAILDMSELLIKAVNLTKTSQNPS